MSAADENGEGGGAEISGPPESTAAARGSGRIGKVGTDIVQVDKGEVAVGRDNAIGATVNTKWLKVAATGQWAAAMAAACILLYISQNLAANAPSAVLLALFGGFLAGRAASNGRVLDAINDRERAYREVERMARAKKSLEDDLLQARISSKVEAVKRKAIEGKKKKGGS